MANVPVDARVSDVDIKRLNNVGLGLRAIAKRLGYHPATISIRLKAMGLPPQDTRRAFMEQVFEELSPDEQEWLSHFLYTEGYSIKEFVSELIRAAHKHYSSQSLTAKTVETEPELDSFADAEVPELDSL